MVVEQSPGVAVGFGLLKESAHAKEKFIPILIVTKDSSLLDASDDDVLQQAGDVYACMSQHGLECSCKCENIKDVPIPLLPFSFNT